MLSKRGGGEAVLWQRKNKSHYLTRDEMQPWPPQSPNPLTPPRLPTPSVVPTIIGAEQQLQHPPAHSAAAPFGPQWIFMRDLINMNKRSCCMNCEIEWIAKRPAEIFQEPWRLPLHWAWQKSLCGLLLLTCSVDVMIWNGPSWNSSRGRGGLKVFQLVQQDFFFFLLCSIWMDPENLASRVIVLTLAEWNQVARCQVG